MLSCEFCGILRNLSRNIYFTNVCEGVPLKNKIFARVSFGKMLGFYYKQKRHFFYYEETSSYILERVNKVNFQNSSELLLLNIPQQTKACSKSTTNECFKNVIRVSL